MPITLELIEARQSELADMIATLKQASATHTITVHSAQIVLQPGERYAGLVLGDDGTPSHHIILLQARPTKRLAWQSAREWANSVGGVLPTLREQALIFAHCREHVEHDLHWSSEAYEDDASCARLCHFYYGYQPVYDVRYEACAVAVRLIHIKA